MMRRLFLLIVVATAVQVVMAMPLAVIESPSLRAGCRRGLKSSHRLAAT